MTEIHTFVEALAHEHECHCVLQEMVLIVLRISQTRDTVFQNSGCIFFSTS